MDKIEDEEDPLEDLDDFEFDLPGVEGTPNLEELLAEEDYEAVVEEDHDGIHYPSSGGLLFDESAGEIVPSAFHLDTVSLISGGSLNSEASGRKKINLNEGSNYIRNVALKGISSQIVSASERINAGIPTVTASSNSLIAVGTSKGFILVFDSQQVLKCSLGGVTFGPECGSVSALAFNPPSTRVIVGFAKGQIFEFDLGTGKQLRDLNDSHPLGHAIIHAFYTDDPTLAVFADSGGSVYEVVMKRTLGLRGYKSRCIFSGAKGEVCAMSPLKLTEHQDHRFSNEVILALATISKVLILSIRPKTHALFTHPLIGASNTLPLLSWHFVVIQTSLADKVVDPVLAFGRESTIYFFQMSENLSSRIVFVPLSKITLDYVMISLGWLNSRCLGICDVNENFHLYDVRGKENLETFDIGEVGLTYGSSFFKGLATGGNVSVAMAVAGQRAVYGSCHCIQNQVLLLGRKGFHTLIIRSWKERIDHLVKSNRYIRAIDLALSFYEDYGKALIGLKGPKERRKKSIANKTVSVLLKFLNVSMTTNFPEEGNMRVLTEYFSEIVPPCVRVCIILKKKDLLYTNVWEAFLVDPFSQAIFLESLEVHILNDEIRDLPVGIVQEYVTHYQKTKRFQALEASITHLEVTSLDIHQTINSSWKYGLYDALFYVYNKGMLDYATPFEELMAKLSSSLHVEKTILNSTVVLGNKILVYVSCCLAGRAYPYGEIEETLVSEVKYRIYSSLTTLHTKQASNDELTYPYLRTLLKFNAQGLFDVVSIAFEEKEFQGEMGRCQKQRLVDILLALMVKNESEFTASQIGHLFIFLARQIAKDPEGIFISRDLFDNVLDVLTRQRDTDSTYNKEERQQALYEMIRLKNGISYFDKDKLVQRCEEACFYKILETVYLQDKRTDKIMECYLFDDDRKRQVFPFIQKVFLSGSFEEKRLLECKVLQEIVSLLRIDPKQTVVVVRGKKPGETLLELISPEELRYQFLKYFIEDNDGESYNDMSSSLYRSYLFLMIELDASSLLPFLKADYILQEDLYQEITELCQNRRIESESLDWGLIRAEVFLLEKRNKFLEGFDVLKESLNVGVNNVCRDPFLKEELSKGVFNVTEYCQRVFSHLNQEQRELVWFAFLETLMAPQRDENHKNLMDYFKSLVKELVNGCTGYIPLRTMILKILRDPLYSEASFLEIKDFLSEMLSMYHYEETLLRSTKAVVRGDLHATLREYKRLSDRGVRVLSEKCELCQTHLGRTVVEISIVFQCSHGYHSKCLKSSGCFNKNNDSWQCYLCLKASGLNSTALKGSRIAEEPISRSEECGDFKENNDLLIDEITRKHVTAAKKYIDSFKGSDVEAPSVSIFDTSEFHLKTVPGTRTYSLQNGF